MSNYHEYIAITIIIRTVLFNHSQQTSSPNTTASAAKDLTVVENGVDGKPLEDESEKVVDENCEEVAATADTAEAEEESLDKRKSPELPIPELQSLPSPDGEDKKENLTDDEDRLTPSGTLSRDGILDE